MALSGSFITNNINGKYLKLTWTATQSTSGNYSYVTAKVYAYSGIMDSYFSGSVDLTIDGTLYTLYANNKYCPIGVETLLVTQSKTVYHSSTGYKNLTMSLSASYYAFPNPDYVNYYGTGSWDLNRILRYAAITYFYVENYGFRKFKVTWDTDVLCDDIEYRYNYNGGAYTSWADGAHPSFYIDIPVPGANYNVQIRIKRADSQLWTESSLYNITSTDINRITSNVPNVTCDSSLTVTVSSPSGAQCDIYIELLNANKTMRIGDKIQHDNTLNTTFSQAELLSLAQYIPNDTSANFRVNATTVYGGMTYYDYKDVIYSIVNANPVFSNFEYEDTNATTLALTGNNQTIIKGYSNLRAKVSTTNKAIAQKGANMTRSGIAGYRLVVGGKQTSLIPYSNDSIVNLDLNAVDNSVFQVFAIDSRQNSTVVQKTPSNYINYFKPVIASATVSRTDDIDEETTLTFNGSFFKDDFGAVENDITVTYKYKKTSDNTWTDGTTTLTAMKSGNSFSFSGLIAGDKGANGFDVQYSYNIRLFVTDKLDTHTYDVILGSGKPNIAIHKDGCAINAPYDESKGGALQVGGEIYVLVESELVKLVEFEEI